MPGGRAGDHDPGHRARRDFSEWSNVAAPTVSITTSTRSGSRAPGSTRGRAQRGDPLPLGGVAAGRVHPLAQRDGEHDGRGGHAAAGALHQHRVGLATRPLVVSIRYAVSQAVGRQAASVEAMPAGLGTRFARGTATRSASVPG